MQTDPTAAAPRFLGKYEVLARLDSGGMAEIFLARARGIAGFEKLVVLKRILPHLAAEEEFVSLFLDEAKTTVALSHGNIVQVFDMGRDPSGDYFIAMEYVAGKNLRRLHRRWIEKKGSPVDPALAAWLAGEILRGLDYAHRRTDAAGRPLGIVHRDLSPHNILVSYEGEVKVADFGIAKAAGKVVHTETGLIRGKASYMSPEQAQGDPLDGRSDLFAVGILLYELLTGDPPYVGEQPQKVLRELTAGALPLPPSAKRPGIAPQLDAIVMRALARSRDERYATADVFLRELGQYLVSTSTVIGPRDLAAQMNDLFGEDIEEERRQLNALPAAPMEPHTRKPPVPVLHGFDASAGPSGAFVPATPSTSQRTAHSGRFRSIAGWPWYAQAAIGVGLLLLPIAIYILYGTLPEEDGVVPTPIANVSLAATETPDATPTPTATLAATTATPIPTATRIVIANPLRSPPAPSPTPAPTAAAAATARISITARPWAYVFFDGKPIFVEGQNVGTWKGQKISATPIRDFEVKAGRHRIEAFQVDETGAVLLRGERTFDVEAGTTPVIQVELKPVS